jgi:hypothetical protein
VVEEQLLYSITEVKELSKLQKSLRFAGFLFEIIYFLCEIFLKIAVVIKLNPIAASTAETFTTCLLFDVP